MAGLSFNTGNETFRQLFGNGLLYQIPRFQRDYSWTLEQWEDLWEDLQAVLSDPSQPGHYMGYLVLQTSDQRHFSVIDGQQRLTTLTLMVLAVIKNLQSLAETGVEPDSNRRRSEQLRQAYVGYLNPVSLIAEPKLSLNLTNDSFFRDYIVPLGHRPGRLVNVSNRLLGRAFDWFSDKVKESYFVRRDGAILAKFLDDIADRLFFTVIRVADELNAFKVFETLNARGVRLSPTDLLKNYLYSIAHRDQPTSLESDALERQWSELVGALGEEDFSDFLRVYWNSRNQFVREAGLFKTIRDTIKEKAAVFGLMRNLSKDLDTYLALSTPDGDLWTPAQKDHVRDLRLFSIRQPWPLLLAAHRSFSADDFTDVLRACSIISFRYNVIGGRSTAEQERVYNRLARDVAEGRVTGAAGVVRGLAPIYPSDEAFRADFAVKSFKTTAPRNKAVANYILFRIENHISNRGLDKADARYSLEHILPENPGSNWPQFTDDEANEAKYRLGNLTPLERSLNKDAGNASFETKAKLYEKSEFALTRSIAEENNDWNFERLENRQQMLAKQATALWRIAQLS